MQQLPTYTSVILCQTDSQPSSLAHLVSELSTRKYLDKYLASAFNLALENGRLKVVDSQQYVLTLDYTLKVGMTVHQLHCFYYMMTCHAPTVHQLVHGKDVYILCSALQYCGRILQYVASTRSQLYIY